MKVKTVLTALGGMLLLLSGRELSAATLTWTKISSGNASGSWTNQANWSGALLPATTNDAANFATLDITGDSTITLDSNPQLNALNFGDASSSSAANWLVNPGSPAASTLTLGGAAPTINVSGLAGGKAVILNAVLTGTNGLIKTGSSFLSLNAANTYSGGTVVYGSDGRISCGNDSAYGTGTVQVGNTVGDGQFWFQSAGNRTHHPLDY